MSVNVRTPTNNANEDDSWDATHWRVEEGHLWVCDVDHLIAEYPPGQWTAVWREQEAKEGDVNRSSGEAESPAAILGSFESTPPLVGTVTINVTGGESAKLLAEEISHALRAHR